MVSGTSPVMTVGAWVFRHGTCLKRDASGVAEGGQRAALNVMTGLVPVIHVAQPSYAMRTERNAQP